MQDSEKRRAVAEPTTRTEVARSSQPAPAPAPALRKLLAIPFAVEKIAFGEIAAELIFEGSNGWTLNIPKGADALWRAYDGLPEGLALYADAARKALAKPATREDLSQVVPAVLMLKPNMKVTEKSGFFDALIDALEGESGVNRWSAVVVASGLYCAIRQSDWLELAAILESIAAQDRRLRNGADRLDKLSDMRREIRWALIEEGEIEGTDDDQIPF